MRVCIDFRPALHQSTGVGTFARGLIRALAERFPEDRYVAFSASWRHRFEEPMGTVARIDARVPVRLLDRLWHRHGWPAVERWTGPIDIAHSPSPLPLPSRGARVVTVHDCHFLRHPEDASDTIRRDYVPRFRAAVRGADGVLAVSQTTADEVREIAGLDADRVRVCYNGVDPMRASGEQMRAARAAFELEGPYLLFVGRREPRKDLPTLLAAFERLLAEGTDSELLLVGPDGNGWSATLAGASPSVRAATRVLDHQPRAVLAALYTGAEALVLPSRWEGFGLTAVEAMSAGVPVVAARTGALPEVLGDAPAWFEVGDVDGLVAARLRLLDADERGRRVAAGAERWQRYTWRRAAERTRELYARVLA